VSRADTHRPRRWDTDCRCDFLLSFGSILDATIIHDSEWVSIKEPMTQQRRPSDQFLSAKAVVRNSTWIAILIHARLHAAVESQGRVETGC
jgi:hypothetical protein